MIFNMESGGAALNYKVIGGTTPPANPANNTIWVETEAEITGHAFSATIPSSPAAGMVWFNVGTSSSAPINALKKNALMVYPTGCKQYINSKWVDKTAKTYQNAAWMDWRTYFYKSGEGALVDFFVSAYFSDPLDGVVGTEYITIKSTYNNGGERGLSTVTPVDISNFNTIYFDILAGTSNFRIGVAETAILYGTTLTKQQSVSENASRQIIAIDVSDLSGPYYIGGNNGRDMTTDEKIYNIYAE